MKKSKDKAKAGAMDLAPDNKKSGGSVLGKLTLVIALGAASFGTVYTLPRISSDIDTGAVETEPAEAKLMLELDTSYLELTPMTVSIQEDGKILKIGITLEVLRGEEAYINPNDPKIRDAFMGYLRALRPEQIKDAAFMAQLRAQLLRRSQLILGSDVIADILITDFLVR